MTLVSKVTFYPPAVMVHIVTPKSFPSDCALQSLSSTSHQSLHRLNLSRPRLCFSNNPRIPPVIRCMKNAVFTLAWRLLGPPSALLSSIMHPACMNGSTTVRPHYCSTHDAPLSPTLCAMARSSSSIGKMQWAPHTHPYTQKPLAPSFR